MAARYTRWKSAGSHLRLQTPPPPDDAVESLSPIHPSLLESARFVAEHNGVGESHHHRYNTQPKRYSPGAYGVGLEDGEIDVHPGRAQYSFASPTQTQVHGSPIDALASIALATSPTFGPPSRRVSEARMFSDMPSYWPTNGTSSTHTAPIHDNQPAEGRPAKRARTEVPSSPQQHYHVSRPATSYNAQLGWSYNVEQAIDHSHGYGQRNTVDVSRAGRPDNTGTIDAAEALLDFARQAARLPTAPARMDQESLSHNSNDVVRHSDAPNLPPFPYSYSVLAVNEAPTSFQPESIRDIQGGHVVMKDGSDGNGHDTMVEERVDTSAGPGIGAAVQTHTPPEEDKGAMDMEQLGQLREEHESKKAKAHQGWPKGKPRGARARGTSSRRTSKSAKTKDNTSTSTSTEAPEQLQSPQSLTAGVPGTVSPTERASDDDALRLEQEMASQPRRLSLPQISLIPRDEAQQQTQIARSRSVPPEVTMTIHPFLVKPSSGRGSHSGASQISDRITTCAGCHFSPNSTSEERQKWISCNGCREWFHFACAGFKTERVARTVDKFFCRNCKPKHGATTYVRKSTRAHCDVDYASLNAGVVRTSDENPEHHYIKSFKDGTFKFLPESFARMPPELVTAEYFERCGGMTEPIVIPARWNPRPKVPGTATDVALDGPTSSNEPGGALSAMNLPEYFEQEPAPDDGQDKLDMVIPQGLTVRRVAELYGLEEKVEIIDVKSQESGGGNWNMRKWAEYYEEEGEKPVRNVISLEVSASKLGRLIRRPKIVRDLDLQDSVWPNEEMAKGNYPKVQFYCLMSVADCYTDFHIDFGGSSVYYHIVKGKKTFFFIPPKKQHLKKYAEWCRTPAQNWTFLPDQTKECYRVDLSEGDTMLIPSGWIHAVWTPENSLVIGGNFLTRLNFGMQIRIAEIEKETEVPRKFRYPLFQKVLWYTVLQYLEQDPVPETVLQSFYEGKQFYRETPIYLEFNKFGHNSDPGRERYNARYYSKGELDGLPDLARYIFRTVMISMGKIDGITTRVREAVTRSIPKGHGEPLELVKTFAMWIAWKRGNEDIPAWAHPEAILPAENNELAPEKKLSAAALKRLERNAAIEAYRVAPERQSERQRSRAVEYGTNGTTSMTGSPAPPALIGSEVKHLSTPKTSVLGPKRIACDACRRRRIRCKHKEDLTSSPGSTDASHNVPLSNPLVPVDGEQAPGPRRSSSTLVAVLINSYASSKPSIDTAASVPNGTTSMTKPPTDTLNVPDGIASKPADTQFETPDSKRARSKACADCRKSKRRCIHDDFGNIDPIKAQESPIPRGSISKKRPPNGELAVQSKKKPKKQAVKPESQLNGVGLPAIDNLAVVVPDARVAGPSFQPNMLVPPCLPDTQIHESSNVAETIDRDGIGAVPSIAAQDPFAILPNGVEQAPAVVEGMTHGPIHPVPAVDINGIVPSTEEPMAVPKEEEELPIPEPSEDASVDDLVQHAVVHSGEPVVEIEPALQTATAPPPPPHSTDSDPIDLVRLSSPLTDLSEPPSPTQLDTDMPPAFDLSKSFRQSHRVVKPVERYTDASYETQTKNPHNGDRRTTSHTPGPLANGIGKSVSPEATHSAKKQTPVRKKSVTVESRRGSKASIGEISLQTPSQAVETEEEASMRLIRELTATELGLRRRSR